MISNWSHKICCNFIKNRMTLYWYIIGKCHKIVHDTIIPILKPFSSIALLQSQHFDRICYVLLRIYYMHTFRRVCAWCVRACVCVTGGPYKISKYCEIDVKLYRVLINQRANAMQCCVRALHVARQGFPFAWWVCVCVRVRAQHRSLTLCSMVDPGGSLVVYSTCSCLCLGWQPYLCVYRVLFAST